MDKSNVCDDFSETNVCEPPETSAFPDIDFNIALSIASYRVFKNSGLFSKRNKKIHIMKHSLDRLNFSYETYAALRWSGFHTVGDLMKDF